MNLAYNITFLIFSFLIFKVWMKKDLSHEISVNLNKIGQVRNCGIMKILSGSFFPRDKTLGISGVIGVSLLSNEVTHGGLESFRTDWSLERPTTLLEVWDFPGRGRGLEIEFNHLANNLINHGYIINAQ